MNLEEEVYLKEFDRLPNGIHSINNTLDICMITISSVLIGVSYDSPGLCMAFSSLIFLFSIILILYSNHITLANMISDYNNLRNDYTENKEVKARIPMLPFDKYGKILFGIGMIIINIPKIIIIYNSICIM